MVIAWRAVPHFLDEELFACLSTTKPPAGARLLGYSVASRRTDEELVLEIGRASRAGVRAEQREEGGHAVVHQHADGKRCESER